MARPRRSDGIRERLLDVGVAAFLEQGYHGTGIQDVVDRAGVPKGSFYHYFASKEAFGAAAIEHYCGALAQKMSDALAKEPRALAGLRRFFEGLMRDFEANRFVGGCLVANLGGEIESNDTCRTSLGSGFRAWSDGVTEALRRSQREGDVREDMSADELAEILIDTWEGAVIRMKIQQSLNPLEQCLDRMLDGYLRPVTRT